MAYEIPDMALHFIELALLLLINDFYLRFSSFTLVNITCLIYFYYCIKGIARLSNFAFYMFASLVKVF